MEYVLKIINTLYRSDPPSVHDSPLAIFLEAGGSKGHFFFSLNQDFFRIFPAICRYFPGNGIRTLYWCRWWYVGGNRVHRRSRIIRIAIGKKRKDKTQADMKTVAIVMAMPVPVMTPACVGVGRQEYGRGHDHQGKQDISSDPHIHPFREPTYQLSKYRLFQNQGVGAIEKILLRFNQLHCRYQRKS